MEESSTIENDDLDLNCSDFSEWSAQMLDQVSFWVEGFLSCSIAMIGFLGNIGSAVILSGKGMFFSESVVIFLSKTISATCVLNKKCLLDLESRL